MAWVASVRIVHRREADRSQAQKNISPPCWPANLARRKIPIIELGAAFPRDHSAASYE